MNARYAGELFPETLAYSVPPPPGRPWKKPMRMANAIRQEEHRRQRELHKELAAAFAERQGDFDYKKFVYPRKAKKRLHNERGGNDTVWTELMQTWVHAHVLRESIEIIEAFSGQPLPPLPWYRKQDLDFYAKKNRLPPRQKPPTHELRELVSAWVWVDDRDSEAPFSFNTCCELRDWDPDQVRKRIERHRPANWHLTMTGLGLIEKD